MADDLGAGDTASCGHPNPIWFTDSRLWNEVMGGDPDREVGGILCPSCFADRADQHFDVTPWRITRWRLVPDMRRTRHPETAEGLHVDQSPAVFPPVALTGIEIMLRENDRG